MRRGLATSRSQPHLRARPCHGTPPHLNIARPRLQPVAPGLGPGFPLGDIRPAGGHPCRSGVSRAASQQPTGTQGGMRTGKAGGGGTTRAAGRGARPRMTDLHLYTHSSYIMRGARAQRHLLVRSSRRGPHNGCLPPTLVQCHRRMAGRAAGVAGKSRRGSACTAPNLPTTASAGRHPPPPPMCAHHGQRGGGL